jgi:uncharacterized protein YjbI with pentapeptide repeats
VTERNNQPGVRITGTPRSIRELSFAAGARPCAHCGSYADLKWKHLDSPPVWRTRAKCPSCGNERVYLFTYTEDLTDVDPPELELGQGPSTVLSSEDLVGFVERTEPLITTPLYMLSDDTEVNWSRVEHVQTALNELGKLVPEGESLRGWVEQGIARYATLVDTVVPVRRAPVERRGALDRASLLAHREWYRTGAGARIDVAGLDVGAMKLDGSQIQRGRFANVDFTGADLSMVDWSEAELRTCKLVKSRLNRANLVGSTILDCVFEDSAAAALDASKAEISGCSFDRVAMPGAVWTEAVLIATRFVGASFGNARWDRGRFVDCDFRDASFEPDREFPPTRMRGALFEGCDFDNANLAGTDLRGATFKRCKLMGAYGEPRYFREVTLEDCDVTLDALEAQLVLPSMPEAELASAGSLIVVRDREDGAAPDGIVFEVGKTGARRRARTSASATGVTHGRAGVVWLPTDAEFSVWSNESRRLVITRTTNALWTPGSTLPVASVSRIASFIDAQHPGRRGVALITPSRDPTRLVFVQEQDMLAIENAAYTIDDARRDGRWAAALGADLAAWLGVPHDELRTDLR